LQSYPPIAELQHLLSRTRLRDHAAFEKLYRLGSPHLFGLAMHMLRDADLARDVVQDAFVSIWRNAGEYDPAISAPMTWMVSIARYRALDLLRKRQPATDVADSDLLDYLDQMDDGNREQETEPGDCAAIQSCMERLPSAQRQSIMLAYFRGLTHSELANHLRQPLGTVKSWVRQGLLQLKDCLGA
jgi:RNA polymerase sigma-70 factor, ECF subfamily